MNTIGNVCQCADLLILNGRAYKDKSLGKKTFFNKRGESTIDYVLCNRNSFRKITNFEIHSPNVHSDHVVISYSISTCYNFNVRDVREASRSVHVKWKSDRKDDFIENIGKSDVQDRVNVLIEQMNNNLDTGMLERSVTELSDILVTTASDHLKLISKERVGRIERERKMQGGLMKNV